MTAERFIFTALLLRTIVPALWGNPPMFDSAENLTQCREYHREQLCNWSKVGRSLGLTCRGQISERRALCEGFLSLTLIPLAHIRGLTFWPPQQVEPSDLPTFDQLQSCSLWYSLHCATFSAKLNGGGVSHNRAGPMSFILHRSCLHIY